MSGGSVARAALTAVRGEATSDGAGVRLTRVIGGRGLPDLDPFLLFDEFRSDDAGDYIAGFPDHPHRGFETVTYMLAGRMRHRDSRGNSGLLLPGSVQWMTAGSGLVHSEMPEQQEGRLWGFQLWVNLPARDKMVPPRYQDIPAREIPQFDVAGGVVRVVAGSQGGVSGPVQGVATEPVYLDIRLAPGAHYEAAIPQGHAAFAFCYEGEAAVGSPPRLLQRGVLATLGDGASVAVSAAGTATAGVLVVAGRPLREPVARYGPFVMNTREEIMQAFEDYRAGRF